VQAETVGTSLASCIAQLPTKVRKQIEACPVEGQGVHPWLFKTALVLHNHFSVDQVEDILSQYVSCDGREREIREAVANSGKIVRGEIPSSSLSKPWPAVDYELIHKTVLDCPVRLKDLQGFSPVRVSEKEPKTEEILDALYPGNPLLCFGRSTNVFRTRPRESLERQGIGFPIHCAEPDDQGNRSNQRWQKIQAVPRKYGTSSLPSHRV